MMRVDIGRSLLWAFMFSLGAACYGGVYWSSTSLAKTGSEAEKYIITYVELVYRNYEDSLSRALELQDQVAALLDNPNELSLKTAQNTWLKAREAYGQSEVFRFYGGPVDFFDSSEGLEGPEGRLNSWPIDESFIDYVVGNSSAGIINDTSIKLTRSSILRRNQSDDDRNVSTGYHAIEFLLWGQDLSKTGPGVRPTGDFFPGTSFNDRRRKYLEIVVAQLVDDHTFLVNEWKPNSDNYAKRFLALPENIALKRILTGILTMSVFELASERMAVALDSGDQEDEHSCFSDNTHNDFVYNALGIENVYYGRYNDFSGVGLDKIIEQVNPSLNERMIKALEQTKLSISEIGSPFDFVLSTPYGSSERAIAESAIDALMLQGALIKEIGADLNLTVSINDGDEG